ncbi:hypothetical protein LOK49_LG01G00241 [Camellia lanceoleosa]|uniref:Uncharacterized protein n=1 Tax=Camellia lanceoleosa TaxID=1840588 RepID=A0ACC0IX97_9ERIC|nr:hypothetical protein LOK49_LG01G00241 [Camellia lanceoleosa]
MDQCSYSFGVSTDVSTVPDFSPAREGPWTTVRLNYAAPAACWRLGYDIVASEVSIKDGNRYVNIRSLVSVCNNTDFTLDVCLKLRGHEGNIRPLEDASQNLLTEKSLESLGSCSLLLKELDLMDCSGVNGAEPDILKEVKQKLDLGSVKFEV